MADLNLSEQRNVRTALRHLRNRVGAWEPLADALHVSLDTVAKSVRGQRPVTVNLAFRVARLAGVSFDDLIEGHYLPGACPRCGYTPDFADEETVVEASPRNPSPPAPPASTPRGLKLVP